MSIIIEKEHLIHTLISAHPLCVLAKTLLRNKDCLSDFQLKRRANQAD